MEAGTLRRLGWWLAVVVLAAGFGTGWPSRSQAAEIAYLAVEDGYWQVWTMRANGQDARPVTRTPYDKTRLSWYPDGKSLLVNGSDGRLRRVRLETGEESLLETPLQGMADAVLSPDGTQIAFSLGPAGDLDANEIWVMTERGKDLRRLTKRAWMQHEPAWSSEGKAIFFLTGPQGRSHDVWRIDLASDEETAFTAGQGFHFDVAVGPNGTIAYSSNRSGNYEIYRQQGQDEAKRLTDHPDLDGRPTWSPDGKALLFESMREGGSNIWRIEVEGESEGRPATRITSHPEGARAPVWYRPGTGARP